MSLTIKLLLISRLRLRNFIETWKSDQNCSALFNAGQSWLELISADCRNSDQNWSALIRNPNTDQNLWGREKYWCAVVMCPHSCVSSSLLCVPHHCCVSSPCCCPLPSSSLSHDVVVAMPLLWHVVWLPRHCWQHGTCVKEMSRGGEVSLPRLVVAHVRTWLLAIVHKPWFVWGQPSSFVGGWLCFAGGRGGSVVIGGHWCSWVVTKVGGGEGCGWRQWWAWLVVVGRKELAMFGEHDAKQTMFVWSSHMRSSHVWSHMMILDSSHGNPPDVPQISIFFSQNWVGLCTELQDWSILLWITSNLNPQVEAV